MPTYGSLPFSEQIAFFRQKVNIPTAAWTDIYGNDHDQAFVVAGAIKADLLSDLRQAVDKAVSQGTGFAEFKKDFLDIAGKRGWAFNGGPGWRARVIFETNVYQSYNAGREAQMANPELRRRRPFGLYKHYSIEHPRPEHLAHDNKVVPLDDPWWDVWSPQNGWGCKCKKFMLSQADVDRRGLKVEAGPPIEYREVTIGTRGPTPRTVRVPVGIDPGFEHRPGRRWHPDLDKYPEPIARQVVADNLRTGIFERWYRSIERAVASKKITGMDRVAAIKKMREELSKAEKFAVATITPAQAQLLGVSTQTVYLSDYDAIKQVVSREGQDLTPDQYYSVQSLLDEAQFISKSGSDLTVWIRRAAQYHQAVLKAVPNGKELYLKSFRRGSEADLVRERKRAKEKGYEVLKDEM